ncbi:MFS transporter [Faecalimonas sp. LCP19S3_D12]
MNKSMESNAKLSLKERLAYGLGDYSNNLICSSINAFLLVYYVSVVGVDAVMAASIIGISKFLDGISDLIMGVIIDNTNSKWGKARPWILRLCVPLGVCTVLMFTVPESLTGGMQFAYMFLTYNLVSTVFYTGVAVPYSALNGLMTTNQYERGLLGNFRMLFATAGTMTINTVVMKMCAYFGNGDEYAQKGWTITFIILMVAYVVLALISFYFCKERVGTEQSRKESVKPITALKSLMRNKYWVLLIVLMFSLYFLMSTFYGAGFYYAQYVVKNEAAYTPIANFLSTAQIAIMFVTPFIMKKMSKRYLVMTGMGLATLGFVLTAFAHTNIPFLLVCSVIKGFGFGCSSAAVYGLLQDAIIFGEWKTGISATGMGNAASSFCSKVGSGVGTAVLGWVLGAGGFDKNPTSASAICSLDISFIWIPAISTAIAFVCMLFFDLDKYYDKAVADLAIGKYKENK